MWNPPTHPFGHHSCAVNHQFWVPVLCEVLIQKPHIYDATVQRLVVARTSQKHVKIYGTSEGRIWFSLRMTDTDRNSKMWGGNKCNLEWLEEKFICIVTPWRALNSRFFGLNFIDNKKLLGKYVSLKVSCWKRLAHRRTLWAGNRSAKLEWGLSRPGELSFF